MPHFYRHSGIVPFGGLVQTLFAGVGAAISIGIAYSFAMVYIPIIYLNFLGTLGFGLAIGFLVKRSARAGRIRNRFVPAAIGFVSAIVGLYFAWGADLLARVGVGQVGILNAFNPLALWSYVQVFYENGAWTLGNHAKDTVKGIPLALVWLTEFGIIVGMATYVPWNEIRSWVFCEDCGWWETVESNTNRFSAVGADKIAERLQQEDLSVLREMAPALPTDMTFLCLHLARCETCDDSNYLDLDQVTVTVDKKGNVKTKLKLLVEKLQISPADVRLVKEAGPPPAAAAETPAVETAAEAALNEGEDHANAVTPAEG